MRRKSGVLGVGVGEDLLFTLVSLNRGIHYAETSYSVSLEQKKQNCLQKLPGVLVSKKDEVICSANKQLCKLVSVYIMLFMEKKKKKKTVKTQKEKKLTILTIIHQATT